MIKKYTIDGITDTWLHQPGMMIYVETEYNEAVNFVIKRYYKEISEWCEDNGLIFLYIPEFYKFGNSQWIYYITGKKTCEIPFESTSIVLKHSLSASSFSQIKGPSFLFSNKDCDAAWACLIEGTDEENIESSIENILSNYLRKSALQVEKELFVFKLNRSHIFPKAKEMDDRIKKDKENCFWGNLSRKTTLAFESLLDEEDSGSRFRVISQKHISDDVFKELDEDDNDIDTRLFQEAQKAIVKLLDRGYSKETIWAMLAPMQELSPIHITKDYRIRLLLYQKEIELPPIQKAIYLLFLKHPEGIYFKELSDYETDLYRIYRRLAVRGINAKHIESIQDLVNPLSNSINEKCSLIKKRILAILDDSLAKHYYISGGKGELKRIDIKPSLIIWECSD